MDFCSAILTALLNQAGIIVAALIGFAGVCITMWWNARLARRAQQNQWNEDRSRLEEQQRRDRNSLRSALRVELNAACEALKRGEESVSNADATGTYAVHVGISEDVYNSAVGRMGLLPDSELEKVFNAYQMLRARREVLRLKRKVLGTADYVHVPAAQIPWVVSTSKEARKSIQAAITALKEGLEKDRRPNAD